MDTTTVKIMFQKISPRSDHKEMSCNISELHLQRLLLINFLGID